MAARLGFETLRPRIVVALAGASLLLIAPMPGVVLDLLLVAQALAAGLAVHRALDERADPAVLPRLLLAGALGRVLVAVALVRAASGHGGMGLVVGSLGVVLQSGGLLGGLGAVLALALLHVMVVARGAERLGQVSARFALDALPGRQLALEGDVRQRLGDPAQAAHRRAAALRDAQTVGAVDGVTRMLRAEAVALTGLLALLFAAASVGGVWERGLELATAARLALGTALGAAVCLQGPALLAAASAAWLALRLSTATPRGDRVNAPPLRLEVAPGTEAAAQRRLAEALDPLGVRGDRVEVVADPTVAAGAARLVRGRALLHAGALEPAFLAAMRRLAAPLLVTTQDVAEALDTLEGRAPVLVRAVVPSRVDLLGLTRVTRALLAEGLPVDDLERVLDALSYLPVDTNDLERARAARRAFADHLTARVHGARGAQAACAGLELESALRRGALSPEGRAELLDQLGALRNETPDLCVVCAPDVRAALAALTADPLPTLEVVGLDELLPGTRLTPVAVL
jgi:flagellar biosynthesis component FlhA